MRPALVNRRHERSLSRIHLAAHKGTGSTGGILTFRTPCVFLARACRSHTMTPFTLLAHHHAHHEEQAHTILGTKDRRETCSSRGGRSMLGGGGGGRGGVPARVEPRGVEPVVIFLPCPTPTHASSRYRRSNAPNVAAALVSLSPLPHSLAASPRCV